VSIKEGKKRELNFIPGENVGNGERILDKRRRAILGNFKSENCELFVRECLKVKFNLLFNRLIVFAFKFLLI